MNETEIYDPFGYPTDAFMAQLTCGIFENATKEVGLLTKWEGKEVEKKRIKEIIAWAKNKKDYWHLCLESFCPTLDRDKICDNIINIGKETLIKLNKKIWD